MFVIAALCRLSRFSFSFVCRAFARVILCLRKVLACLVSPDPDAEEMALSSKMLMELDRYVCEI